VAAGQAPVGPRYWLAKADADALRASPAPKLVYIGGRDAMISPKVGRTGRVARRDAAGGDGRTGVGRGVSQRLDADAFTGTCLQRCAALEPWAGAKPRQAPACAGPMCTPRPAPNRAPQEQRALAVALGAQRVDTMRSHLEGYNDAMMLMPKLVKDAGAGAAAATKQSA
jgi:hypothetical protein